MLAFRVCDVAGPRRPAFAASRNKPGEAALAHPVPEAG